MNKRLMILTDVVAVMLTFAAVAAIVSGAAGCGEKGTEIGEDKVSSASPDSGGATDVSFSVTSADFTDGGGLPVSSGCESQGGENLSPQISWQGAPAETTSYAVIMDDEDPPCGAGDDACRHWAVFNIPASVASLSRGEDISKIAGADKGQNFQGENGYAGPCPPNRHTYRITVFALGHGMPEIPAGTPLTRSELNTTYGDFILAQDTISGSFGS